MINVQIIVGSTRPNRLATQVTEWTYGIAKKRDDMKIEVVDIADFELPLLDEPIPPSMGQYSKDHTHKWAKKISEADAFVFIAPEYNHGIPGALKNAIDYLYAEWNDKAAAFVSYGSAGGVRSVEHLRQVMAEIQIADVRENVMFNLAQDFENYAVHKPSPTHESKLNSMLDQLLPWAEAMKSVREKKASKKAV